MASDRHFVAGIEEIEGIWAEAAARFSYTSLTEAEDCPRRWSLRRSDYLGLWPGNGYPDRPSVAALAGEVVHRSLETIVGALVANGCTGPQDEYAVSVMRSLGGYSEVIREAIDERIQELGDNPRCRDTAEQIAGDLLQRVADMRRETQALVSRTPFLSRDPQREPPAEAGPKVTGTRHLPDGSYAEFTLRSTSLRLIGRADLVTLAGTDVHIVDYKTGEPSPQHAEQLRLYALLWSRSDHPDPLRPYATRLSASYPGLDVDIAVPDEIELEEIERQTAARIARLEEHLAEYPPEARPATERCRRCSVRHLCDPYWQFTELQANSVGRGDLRGIITESCGPRAWTLRLMNGDDVLLLGTDGTSAIRVGAHLRVLDAQIKPASDNDQVVASLTSASEVYVER